MNPSAKTRLLAAVIAAATLFVLLAPAPPGWSDEEIRAAGLTLAAIALWATSALPSGLTALGYFLGAMLLAVQPASVVFSGFTSAAFWLVFGGLVVGVAIRHTGLGERIARAIAAALHGSYLAILVGIAAAATALAFLMPSSMGRVVTMTPIVLAIADRYGFVAGRPGRAGMVMVALLNGFMPAGAILTALVPNLVLAGAAENFYGIHFAYGDYLLIHYPVMGFLRSIASVLLAARIFRDTPDAPGDSPDPSGAAAASPTQTRLAVILCLALGLWMTDSLHGIAPAWIALAAAVMLLVPGLGFVPSNTLNEHIDYGSALYVAAVLGMGAVISGTGLAADVGEWLAATLPLAAGADATNLYLLAISAAALALVVTNPGVPAVLAPIAGSFAVLTDLPVRTVLMSEVAGFSNVLLPYQASPILVGMALGGVALGKGTKLLVALTLVTLTILLPLELLWWRYLGLF